MFILIFLLGFALMSLLSREFKITEKLALAMPMGLGLASFLMFLIDRTTHSITSGSVMGSVAICGLAMGGLRLYIDWRTDKLPWKQARPKVDFMWLNLVWMVFAGMTAYLVYSITQKCLYWPPAEFDTILGYDLLSKAIAREHVIANSILTNSDIVNGCGPRMLYPPLLSLCNSLCYMTGMGEPKLINAFFFVSWSFIIYLLLRRFVSSSGAIIFAFLIIVTPEMFAHASFSLTNLPCAIYTTIAVVSFVIWYEQKKEGFFYLSLLAVIFGIWTRSEAVLFAGAILVLLIYDALKEKRYKYFPIYALSVIPFFLWNAFLKAYVPRDQAGPFIKHAFYDTAKLHQVIRAAWEIMGSSNIYGLTFYLIIAGFLVIILVNLAINFKNKWNKYALGAFVIWLIIYSIGGGSLFSLAAFALLMIIIAFINEEKWELLFIFFTALGMYTLMFYQMKDEQNALFGPGGWLQSGYKRGLFCYAPLGLFIVASSRWVSWLFAKLDDQLRLFNR